MAEETKETKGIDWSQATDEQLQGALAEKKRREPLVEFEDLDWGTMPDTEYQANKAKVFSAAKAVGRERRINDEHADMTAAKAAREQRG